MDVPLMVQYRDGDDNEKFDDKVKGWFGLGVVPQDLLSPILGSSVLLPFSVAYAGVVASASPCLAPFTPVFLSCTLATLAVSSLFFCKFSQFTTCTNVDLLTAAFLSQFCKAILTVEPTLCGENLMIHMLVAQSVFAVLLGGALWVAAAMDAIWYLRFLPYPVACGFVSGIGLLIMDGGFELGSGTTMQELATSWGMLPTEVYCHSAAVVAAGAYFHFQTRYLPGPMSMPIGLMVVTIAVHGGAQLLGYNDADLARFGLFMEGLQAEPWTREWTSLAGNVQNVQVSSFFNMPVISLFSSYVILHLMSWAFYSVGMQEIDQPEEKFDSKREISVLGVLNMLMGMVGAGCACHSFKVCVVMKSSGARSRAWVLVLGLALLFLFFEPDFRGRLAYVPKCAFGGLVFSLGVGFLIDSLLESKKRIAAVEWRAVVMTAVVTYFNVLLGIAFGSLLMMGFFIVEYSGITGVVRQADLSTVRSLVSRNVDDMNILAERGCEVAIFWCSGYIFFGTAANIIENIEAILEEKDIRTVILDFDMVPAVDASGVHALTEFAGSCRKRKPPTRVIFCGLVRRLQLAIRNVAEAKEIPTSPMLDFHRFEQALDWAEGQVLRRAAFRDKSHVAPLKKSTSSPNLHAVLVEEPVNVDAPGAQAVDDGMVSTLGSRSPRKFSEALAATASMGDLDAIVDAPALLNSNSIDMVPAPAPTRLRSGAAILADESSSAQQVLEAVLEEMAPNAPPEGVHAVAELLKSAVELRTYDSATSNGKADGRIYAEGAYARHLVYILSGTASLTRRMEPNQGYKIPRHHLNEAKGDVFVFEESWEVYLQGAGHGTMFGACEFCAALGKPESQWPRRVTSAVAAPRCRVLLVPYKEMHVALAQIPAVGYPVMAWLSRLSSAQVLELLRDARMNTYREMTPQALEPNNSFSRQLTPGGLSVKIMPGSE